MYLEKFKLDESRRAGHRRRAAIGLGCVEALAEAGAKVVIADITRRSAEARPRRHEGEGPRRATWRSST